MQGLKSAEKQQVFETNAGTKKCRKTAEQKAKRSRFIDQMQGLKSAEK